MFPFNFDDSFDDTQPDRIIPGDKPENNELAYDKRKQGERRNGYKPDRRNNYDRRQWRDNKYDDRFDRKHDGRHDDRHDDKHDGRHDGMHDGRHDDRHIPKSSPPRIIPFKEQAPGLRAVDPMAIRGCLYKYTYIWLANRQQFWFYPTYVGRDSVAGYRWNGYKWTYSGLDLKLIESFACVG